MQTPEMIELVRRPLDMSEYKLRGALERDYSRLITTPTIIRDRTENKVAVVYLELEDDCSQVTAALQRIRYLENARTNGMRVRSRIFGFMPRVTIRQDFCTAASLAYDDPQAHALITSYASKVARYYEAYNPDLYAEHQRLVSKVLPDWKLGEEVVFTSGIINKNNPLLYHHDAGNFRNVWSNMLVFKHETSGGYLAVPEYDIGFQLKNNSLLMFDGQQILHGVTPITLASPFGYRYSIVYYSLRGLWNCLTPGEELERTRRLHSQREHKRGGAYEPVHAEPGKAG